MGKRTWSPEDDDELRRLYLELGPQGRHGEIPELLGRSSSSVRHRASRLGVANSNYPRPRGENNKRWTGGRAAAIERTTAKRAAGRRRRGATEQLPWSEADDALLASLCTTTPVSEIAAVMGRSIGSIRGRKGRLGLAGLGRGVQPQGAQHPHWKGGRAASFRRTRYQLEPHDYELLLESQAGGCAICGRMPAESKRGFHVDHDHKTGEVRGILCHHCNLLLGQAKDDTTILLRAVAYLERTEGPIAA